MEFALLVYSAAVAGLALFGLHRLALLLVYLRARSREVSPPIPPRRLREDPSSLPVVTVQLPIYNERAVAARLVIAACRLQWPRQRLQIQVLDDSTDDTHPRLQRLVRRLRRIGHPVELLHRDDRTGFKAGALEEGLRRAHGDLVAVFDADFLPPADFLRRLVGEFDDPRVGMVQSRWGHLNRESSLLTRLQAIFLDGHFLIEHVARASTGRFFNFNGTAGIWRRRAIEDAGGWEHDTLTEDLDLSYRAQLAGWRFVYRPDVCSDAELPSDMNAFKAQQHRWAKGSVQTARKLLPRILRAPLPWPIRLEAFLHLTNNLSYLLMAVPVILWVPTLALRFDTHRPWAIALATVMSLTTLCVLSYHLACQRATGRRLWTTLGELPALVSLGIGLSVNNGRAVLEAIAGKPSPFLRTPKSGESAAGPVAPPRAYALRAHGFTWIELGLALYFGAGLVMAIHTERWLAVPFLLLFLLGFGYVGLASMGRPPHRLLHWGSIGACLGLAAMALWAGQAWVGTWIGP